MRQFQGGVRVHVRRRARGIGLGMRRGGGVSRGSRRRWRWRRRCGTGEGGRDEGEGNGVARARGTDLLRGGVSTAVQAMADTLGELRRNRRGLGQSRAARLLHRWLRGTVRGTWRTPLKRDFSTKDDANNEINWGVEMTLPWKGDAPSLRFLDGPAPGVTSPQGVVSLHPCRLPPSQIWCLGEDDADCISSASVSRIDHGTICSIQIGHLPFQLLKTARKDMVFDF